MAQYQQPKIYLYRQIVQAKIFIDTHYCDSIQLTRISGEAYFSKFHFIRLFKTIYGKTPHQYLTTVRIDKAKELLQGDLPVAAICFAVGFDSVSSFTGLFKRHTGLTPSAYQQLQKLRHAEIKKVPLKFVPNCFAEAKGWTQNSNFEEVKS